MYKDWVCIVTSVSVSFRTSFSTQYNYYHSLNSSFRKTGKTTLFSSSALKEAPCRTRYNNRNQKDSYIRILYKLRLFHFTVVQTILKPLSCSTSKNNLFQSRPYIIFLPVPDSLSIYKSHHSIPEVVYCPPRSHLLSSANSLPAHI